MKVKYYIKNVDGVIVPKRANESDAGYDVIATSGPKITGEVYSGPSYKRIDYVEYETNLYISPDPKDRHFHTDLRPRSSISKYNLVLANSVGLIDRGYKNQILARFKYVWNPEDYQILGDLILGTPNINKMYQKGDKICQLVPMETHTVDFTLVKDLDGEDRGGGFGSTDKPVDNTAFVLRSPTTIEKAFAGSNSAKIDMAKAYFANFQGETYAYTENGYKGICVVDYSGTILHKTPLEKIS
jgi:dUTPase